jgi:flagellar biosynthesis GTPase FlhF
MDHYPEVNVEVHEHPSSASRHDSASSVTKAADFHSPPSLVPSRQPSHNMSSTTAPSNTSTQQHTLSDPATSDATEQQFEQQEQQEQQDRKDSITDEQTAQKLKAEFARYTDAPPPYSEEQYADKTEEQQLSMRTHDYAKELSRMMGRQLVRGLRTDEDDR